MSFQTYFPPPIITQLAKDFGLPYQPLCEALEEGERIWASTRQENKEDRENMECARKILQQLRDYQRGKQKTLNEEVRELVNWQQDNYLKGNHRPTEAEAIEHIKFLFSRPSGARQMSIYDLDLDLEALRKFSYPLRELWIRLGKSWTVTSNDCTRKNDHSRAEQFFLACASHLESELSHAQVRSVIMRPFPTKDEGADDPSDYQNLVMTPTKQGLFIKKIR
jgi:hypothetical protein